MLCESCGKRVEYAKNRYCVECARLGRRRGEGERVASKIADALLRAEQIAQGSKPERSTEKLRNLRDQQQRKNDTVVKIDELLKDAKRIS